VNVLKICEPIQSPSKLGPIRELNIEPRFVWALFVSEFEMSVGLGCEDSSNLYLQCEYCDHGVGCGMFLTLSAEQEQKVAGTSQVDLNATAQAQTAHLISMNWCAACVVSCHETILLTTQSLKTQGRLILRRSETSRGVAEQKVNLPFLCIEDVLTVTRGNLSSHPSAMPTTVSTSAPSRHPLNPNCFMT
jgi:hypothetical protein